MRNGTEFKIETEGFEVEYEFVPFAVITDGTLKSSIHSEIAEMDDLQNKLYQELEEENKEIKKLKNYADGLDYTIAVASGILCGMIDSFFIGEFSLAKANEWGTEKVEKFVQSIAKHQSGKEKDLYDSICYLENQWKISSDNKANIFGGALRHHLHDFAHHPSPVGLFFSLLTQFTGNAYGVNNVGSFVAIPVDPDYIGKDFHSKISLGVITWFFHLVSDVAGSSSSVGLKRLGTGLPGPFVSFLYEVSMLPCFRAKDGTNNFSLWISRLWNGKYTNRIRVDLRTELGVTHELGKQAIPVIINECLVRGFYFIRRFVSAVKSNPIHDLSDFVALDWDTILPFKNRTIVRMLTIATGTFTAVDLADAGIRAAIKSGGNGVAFLGQFIMRVNIVGIGRFAVAVYTDIKMGIKRNKVRDERIKTINQMLHLSNAKIFYKQAEAYIELSDLDEAINNCKTNLLKAVDCFNESIRQTQKDFEEVINTSFDDIRRNDPEFAEKMRKVLDGECDDE